MARLKQADSLAGRAVAIGTSSPHRRSPLRGALISGSPRYSGDEAMAPKGQNVDSSGCNPEKAVDGITDPSGVQLGSRSHSTPGLAPLARRFPRFRRGLFTFNPFGISPAMAFGFPERPVLR